MALPSNPNSGGGGTLQRLVESVKGTAKGIGQQVTGSAAREEAIEANRERKKQVALLEKIEENTRKGGEGDDDDKNEGEQKSKGLLGAIFGLFAAVKAFSITGFVSGLFKGLFGAMGRALMAGLRGIAGFIGRGLLALGRSIFNAKFLLRFVTRIFPLAMIFAALGKGIYDAFTSWMEGGTIGEVIGNFFGGLIEFITFGLIDSETIVSAVTGFFDWMGSVWQSIKDAFNTALETVTGFIDEYIVTPISEAFAFVGQLFKDYIADPIRNAFETISNFMTEYIVDPITNAFNAVSEWFSSLFDPIVSFFDDFGIPEMHLFTNPITGNEWTIGPWYPFRSTEEGATTISASDSVSSTTTTNADGSVDEQRAMDEYIMSRGQYTDIDGNLTDDTTEILSESTRERQVTDADGNVIGTRLENESVFADFNTRTGVATIDGEEVDKSVYRAARRAAESGEDAFGVREAIEMREAYNELSWWRRARSIATGADPRDLLAQQNGDDRDIESIAMERVERGRVIDSATGIDEATGTLASAREEGTNVTVVAPTTSNTNVNSSNNVAVSPSVRSQDSTMSQYQMNAAVG